MPHLSISLDGGLETASPEHDLLAHEGNARFQMKRIISTSVLGLFALLIASGSAQSPPAPNKEQELLALVKEVQAQQAQIAGNQAKIDGKMAEVVEAVRIARIFAGRGGR